MDKTTKYGTHRVMIKTVMLTADEGEIAHAIGMTPIEYIEYKIRAEAEVPLVKRLSKLFAKHRGKKRPTRRDTDAAIYALYALSELGLELNPSSAQAIPSES